MRANRFELPRDSTRSGSTRFPTVPMTEVPALAPNGSADADRPVVLVVDQEPDIADAVAELLKRNGYAAIPAYDAEDALETALLIPPELVVADIRFPAGNGIDVASVLKAKLPECKVLLLSEKADNPHPAAKEESTGHGFAGIDASVPPTDLPARVSALIKSQSKHRTGN